MVTKQTIFENKIFLSVLGVLIAVLGFMAKDIYTGIKDVSNKNKEEIQAPKITVKEQMTNILSGVNNNANKIDEINKTLNDLQISLADEINICENRNIKTENEINNHIKSSNNDHAMLFRSIETIRDDLQEHEKLGFHDTMLELYKVLEKRVDNEDNRLWRELDKKQDK